MFLFIRNLAVSCILRIMTAIVLLLLVVTRVTARVSMTRTRKGSQGEVRYLAEFGKWEIHSVLNERGHTLSLLRLSDTMLIIDQASKSTETTSTETDPRLPDV